MTETGILDFFFRIGTQIKIDILIYILILVILFFGAVLFTRYKNDIREIKFLRYLFTTKMNIWSARLAVSVFLFLTVMTFIPDQAMAVSATKPENQNSTINAKVQGTTLNGGHNDLLYQYLQADLIEQALDEDFANWEIRDFEAFMFMTKDLGKSSRSLAKYKMDNLTYASLGEIYQKVAKAALNKSLSDRDSGKFYWGAVSDTIFYAETLDQYGLLNLTVKDLATILEKNASDFNLQNSNVLNVTLRQLIRSDLVTEFAQHPPSIAPQNDKYEPALATALQIGLISLQDIGLPKEGITYNDYLLAQLPFMERSVVKEENSTLMFKQLASSSFTLQGNNSLSFTLPTLADYFTPAELQYIQNDYYQNQLLKQSPGYMFELQIEQVPDVMISPLLEQYNLIYWSNMTLANYTVTYQGYDYVTNNETGAIEYTLVNMTQDIPYYMESKGIWSQDPVTQEWTYQNQTAGKFVWNMTTLGTFGYQEVNPEYYMNVTITDTENQYFNEILTVNPGLERIIGKVSSPNSANQTLHINLQQNIFSTDNFTYTNETEYNQFIDRLLLVDDQVYYFPTPLFADNVSTIIFSVDAAGKKIIPYGAILLDNNTDMSTFVGDVSYEDLIMSYVTNNAKFNLHKILD